MRGGSELLMRNAKLPEVPESIPIPNTNYPNTPPEINAGFNEIAYNPAAFRIPNSGVAPMQSFGYSQPQFQYVYPLL